MYTPPQQLRDPESLVSPTDHNPETIELHNPPARVVVIIVTSSNPIDN